jgi:hypothetical protein
MVTKVSLEPTMGTKVRVLASKIDIRGPFIGGPAPLFFSITSIVGSIGNSDRTDEINAGAFFTPSEPSEARQAATTMAHHGLLSMVARIHFDSELFSPLTAPERFSLFSPLGIASVMMYSEVFQSKIPDSWEARNWKLLLC